MRVRGALHSFTIEDTICQGGRGYSAGSIRAALRDVDTRAGEVVECFEEAPDEGGNRGIAQGCPNARAAVRIFGDG